MENLGTHKERIVSGFSRIRLWKNIQSKRGVTFLYLSTLIAYLVVIISDAAYLVIFQFVLGSISLIIIPGAILTSRLLPEDMRNIGSSIILGFALLLLECQASFVFVLSIGLRIPLIYWTVIPNTILVLASLIESEEHLQFPSIADALGYKNDPRLLRLMFFGFMIRIFLTLVFQNSISPDASLIADYSISVLNGDFNSHVLNDISVWDLWNDANYIIHQGYGYLLAISWLLLPPSGLGPIVILAIVGAALISPAYWIARHFFGASPAYIVSAIITLQPLFLFHSVVGYGPEITTILFMSFGLIFLLRNENEKPHLLFLGGLFIGLVDAIWYANFYVFCMIFPILALRHKNQIDSEAAIIIVSSFCLLISKLLYQNLIVFALLWASSCIILGAGDKVSERFDTKKYIPLFIAIGITIFAWRWPIQISSNLSTLQLSLTDVPLFSAIATLLSLDLILRFLLFLLFHVTPVIVCLVILASKHGENKRAIVILTLMAFVCAIGTIKVFGLIPGSLELQYLYSDSRFFLFIAFCLIIALGSYFAGQGIDSLTLQFWKRNHQDTRKPLLIAGVLLLSFLPGYFAFPVGTELVNIPNRYGWIDLEAKVNDIGNESTVFLVDRAREFAWYTGRLATVLELSDRGIPIWLASNEMRTLSAKYDCDYLLLDEYTVASWGTLNFFYEQPISTNLSIPIGIADENWTDGNITNPITALTLIAATEPNANGRYARLYKFGTVIYEKWWEGGLLDSGWNVTQGASISNYNGFAEITIGENYNYTYSFRFNGFDLGLEVTSGLLICDTENRTGNVTRIEVWDNTGTFIGFAESIPNSVFYLHLYNVTIGDIRVVIEGNSGDSAIVKSFSIWQ